MMDTTFKPATERALGVSARDGFTCEVCGDRCPAADRHWGDCCVPHCWRCKKRFECLCDPVGVARTRWRESA